MGCAPSSSELQKEDPFDLEVEAKDFEILARRQMRHMNMIVEPSVERIKLFLSGKKRIRLMNRTTQPIAAWISEDPADFGLQKTHSSVGLDLSAFDIISLKASHERESGIRHPDKESPITQVVLEPDQILPMYVLSSAVYLTFATIEEINENKYIYYSFRQVNRRVPTSTIFIFRPFHLQTSLGIYKTERYAPFPNGSEWPRRTFEEPIGEEVKQKVMISPVVS